LRAGARIPPYLGGQCLFKRSRTSKAAGDWQRRCSSRPSRTSRTTPPEIHFTLEGQDKACLPIEDADRLDAWADDYWSFRQNYEAWWAVVKGAQ
jgi:hypothetical protein